MKKSRIMGGSSSSNQSASVPTEVKFHNYFGMKVMASLTNVEITIEDSEVSVNSHYYRPPLSKDICYRRLYRKTTSILKLLKI
jgi:hypothetical protein